MPEYKMKQLNLRYLKILILAVIVLSGFSMLEFNPEPALSQNKPTVACSQYPSGLSTPSAKDPKIVDQEAYKKEGATWDYRWEADCTQGCSNNSDCTANTANSPAVATGTSAWCFAFTDGNRCMTLTTTDKGLGEDKNKSGGKFGQGGATPGQSGPGTGAPGTGSTTPSTVCKGDAQATQKAYSDAKVANNLVRFYAILEGVAGLCVPADLGVTPQENVDGKRLLLCSGKDSALVWRAVDGTTLKPITGKEDPSRDTLKEGFAERIKAAEKAAGL